MLAEYQKNCLNTNSIHVKDKLSDGYPKIGIHVWNNADPRGQQQPANEYCPAATIGSPLKFAVTDQAHDLNCPYVSGEISVCCPVVSGEILVCNGKYGGTGWLAIAQISVASGGTIVLAKYDC